MFKKHSFAGVFLTGLIAFIITAGLMGFLIYEIVDMVSNVGLKNIVDSIWYGKGVK